MRIAICDDEEEYIVDVERHLNQYANERGLFFDICKFSDSRDILKSDKHFDIAFLDIEMDGPNGIEVARQLQTENPDTVLIFVTAYNHYLDDALDLGITRFFDKPIDSRRFYEGMDRAISKVDSTEVGFYLKNDINGYVSIKCKDVVFVEIKGRKTRVVTKKAIYYSEENIKAWKEKLNKSYFESPHNSYIINTNYITYYCREYVILDGRYQIPIAYSKRAEFKRKFMRMMEN